MYVCGWGLCLVSLDCAQCVWMCNECVIDDIFQASMKHLLCILCVLCVCVCFYQRKVVAPLNYKEMVMHTFEYNYWTFMDEVGRISTCQNTF